MVRILSDNFHFHRVIKFGLGNGDDCMKEKILANRKQFLIGECICLIFFGCFTFPVYNFSKEAPEISRWINVFVSLAAYYEIGLIQGVLFEYKEHLKCMGLTLSMTVIGLLGRYLLEFGEVSNTYNFILPNIVLHLFMSVIVTGVGRSNSVEKI